MYTEHFFCTLEKSTKIKDTLVCVADYYQVFPFRISLSSFTVDGSCRHLRTKAMLNQQRELHCVQSLIATCLCVALPARKHNC